MRVIIALLLLMLITLQYRLWVGEGSLAEVYGLRRSIDEQQAELALLRRRNSALQAEVADLKRGLEAVEERARSELGMIRDQETFYQVIEPEQGTGE